MEGASRAGAGVVAVDTGLCAGVVPAWGGLGMSLSVVDCVVSDWLVVDVAVVDVAVVDVAVVDVAVVDVAGGEAPSGVSVSASAGSSTEDCGADDGTDCGDRGDDAPRARRDRCAPGSR